MYPFPAMLLPSLVPEPDTATETAYSGLEPEEAILILVKAQVWGGVFFLVCFYNLFSNLFFPAQIDTCLLN